MGLAEPSFDARVDLGNGKERVERIEYEVRMDGPVRRYFVPEQITTHDFPSGEITGTLHLTTPKVGFVGMPHYEWRAELGRDPVPPEDRTWLNQRARSIMAVTTIDPEKAYQQAVNELIALRQLEASR